MNHLGGNQEKTIANWSPNSLKFAYTIMLKFVKCQYFENWNIALFCQKNNKHS